MQKCPKCHSTEIIIIGSNDISFVKCKNCGYDESLYDVTPTEKTSQREKGRYTPYKRGGGKRTQR